MSDFAIYKPMVSRNYEYVYPVSDADFQPLILVDGKPRKDSWRPIPVQFGPGLSGSKARRSDFPWLSGMGLVLREVAATALEPIIRPHAELLKLDGIDGSELFALNVTSIVDALDHDLSKLRRAPGDIVIGYDLIVFKEDVVRGLDLFRLPYRSSPTYLSERFVDAVARNKLVGLDFHRVWPLA